MTKKKKKNARCYWCQLPLTRLSSRRYMGKVGNKMFYVHFCDDVCEQCYLFNDCLEKGIDPSGIINDIGAYSYGKRETKRCRTCQEERKTKEFNYKLVIKCPENNSNNDRSYFCSSWCLKEYCRKM